MSSWSICSHYLQVQGKILKKKRERERSFISLISYGFSNKRNTIVCTARLLLIMNLKKTFASGLSISCPYKGRQQGDTAKWNNFLLEVTIHEPDESSIEVKLKTFPRHSAVSQTITRLSSTINVHKSHPMSTMLLPSLKMSVSLQPLSQTLALGKMS